MIKKNIKIGFFGTPEYAVITLNKIKEANQKNESVFFDISFIVTVPDKPKGRKMIMTPPPVKVWAMENNIPVFQPEKLKDEKFVNDIKSYDADVFIVMAYGKIIPEIVLNIPKRGCLNIHPSLLPLLRGSCPIESAILNDMKNTGVTIIRLDKEMDHGPIIAQKEIAVNPWPPEANTLGNTLVEAGSEMLISILPEWISGNIKEIEQDHSKATFTKMIVKEDALIDLNDDAYRNFLKIQAYHMWPNAYFFVNRDGSAKDGMETEKIRVKINKASYVDGKLIIEKVIPEGKGIMNY